MKIVIAGGKGFVGRNLVRVMLKEGFKAEEITILDFDKYNTKFFKDYPVNIVSADLSQDGEWVEELKGADYLINLAAQISSPSYDNFFKNNVLATKNLIKASQNADLEGIIHFSSAAVLSVRKDNYAETKAEGEKIVVDSGIKYCVIRPSLMYGPTDEKNIGYLINFAKKFPFFPIPGNGKWPRQPIYIDDMCYLVISLLNDFPMNEIYSINGKEVIFFKDMIKTVLDELGGFKFRLFLPVSVFKFAMFVYQKLIGSEEFTTDQVDSLTAEETFPDYPWWDLFNIKITSFKEGVKIMVDIDKNSKV
jgi:nucleoside-diphosphate-sugar epimerase